MTIFVFPPDFFVFPLHKILQLHLLAENSVRVVRVNKEDIRVAELSVGSRSTRLGYVPVVDGEDVPVAILRQPVVAVLEGLPERPDELALLSEELQPPKKYPNYCRLASSCMFLQVKCSHLETLIS